MLQLLTVETREALFVCFVEHFLFSFSFFFFNFTLQKDNSYEPYPIEQVRHISHQLVVAVKCKSQTLCQLMSAVLSIWVKNMQHKCHCREKHKFPVGNFERFGTILTSVVSVGVGNSCIEQYFALFVSIKPLFAVKLR